MNKILANTAPNSAYEPAMDGIEVVTVDQQPIYLSRWARLVHAGAKQYQVVSGAFTGLVIAFEDFDACQRNLRPVSVFMTNNSYEVFDIFGNSIILTQKDRLVALPDLHEYIVTAGVNRGCRFDKSELEGKLQKVS